jgi:hypothetical protein
LHLFAQSVPMVYYFGINPWLGMTRLPEFSVFFGLSDAEKS